MCGSALITRSRPAGCMKLKVPWAPMGETKGLRDSEGMVSLLHLDNLETGRQVVICLGFFLKGWN